MEIQKIAENNKIDFIFLVKKPLLRIYFMILLFFKSAQVIQ